MPCPSVPGPAPSFFLTVFLSFFLLPAARRAEHRGRRGRSPPDPHRQRHQVGGGGGMGRECPVTRPSWSSTSRGGWGDGAQSDGASAGGRLAARRGRGACRRSEGARESSAVPGCQQYLVVSSTWWSAVPGRAHGITLSLHSMCSITSGTSSPERGAALCPAHPGLHAGRRWRMGLRRVLPRRPAAAPAPREAVICRCCWWVSRERGGTWSWGDVVRWA